MVGKGMAYVRRRTVSVIRIALNDNRRAAGAVPLVSNFIKARTGSGAYAFGNSALDIILRHIVLLCFCQSQF